MLNDFDEINAILNAMADDGMIESVAEPIDENDASPLDWAEVTGLVDEVFENMYPAAEIMLDENGSPWYVS